MIQKEILKLLPVGGLVFVVSKMIPAIIKDVTFNYDDYTDCTYVDIDLYCFDQQEYSISEDLELITSTIYSSDVIDIRLSDERPALTVCPSYNFNIHKVVKMEEEMIVMNEKIDNLTLLLRNNVSIR